MMSSVKKSSTKLSALVKNILSVTTEYFYNKYAYMSTVLQLKKSLPIKDRDWRGFVLKVLVVNPSNLINFLTA